MNYQQFIESKRIAVNHDEIPHDQINEALFPFQRQVVEKLLGLGKAAAFLDTGLGKTIVQCEWARHVPGEVLILAPLAVAQQTIREAKKLLGMEIGFSSDGEISNRITVTNYERLHNFNCSRFSGVVLDESSILKSFMGKTKQNLVEQFKSTRYKLACTATPAPNDYMELGNHSEFLGVMASNEMLSRWFINDPSKVGNYRLKGHAIEDFWHWVSSWAACVSKPSDLGYDDTGYDLPPLVTKTHMVKAPLKEAEDMLFDIPGVSATELHSSKRETFKDRCKLVADMVNSKQVPWIVWCESNQESEELARLIPDCVEVKGADSLQSKEKKLMDFTDGNARVIVSKPSICGFGMNWQHCRDIAFASISYSYEKFYQAIRRSWRFGQTEQVNVHVVIADSELQVWKSIERKTKDHDLMKSHMKHAVFRKSSDPIEKRKYNPTKKAKLTLI